jgi:hypothetical protein
MPTSIDPPPADDELECGRCGAHFHYELTRCPNCGVNVYEPDDDPDGPGSDRPRSSRKKLGDRLEDLVRRVTKKPYAVDELFGASINQANLFDSLLTRVGGDRAKAERLIEFERGQFPQGNRIAWLERALQRWERDNHTPKPGN